MAEHDIKRVSLPRVDSLFRIHTHCPSRFRVPRRSLHNYKELATDVNAWAVNYNIRWNSASNSLGRWNHLSALCDAVARIAEAGEIVT